MRCSSKRIGRATLALVVAVLVSNVTPARAQVTNPDYVTLVRGESVTVDLLANDDPGLTIIQVGCGVAPVGFAVSLPNKDGTVTFSASESTACPTTVECFYSVAKGHLEQIFVTVVCPPSCPCDRFAVSDFGSPMGKKKQLGATLPVKFQLFFDGVEVTSQEELDFILTENGCEPACPEIRIFEVTDEAEEIGLELPEDLSNVGEGGDLGTCFRYSAPNWVYNLSLPNDVFYSGRTYRVEVVIGSCIFQPGNDLFQIK